MPFLAAILDYLRGKDKHRAVYKFFYGLVVCLVAGVTGWVLIPGAILFGLGISIGWGKPLGDGLRGQSIPTKEHYERWQIGPLRKSVHLALAARGILTGLPLILITYFHHWVWLKVALAFAVAFPLAVYLAYQIAVFRRKHVGDWNHQEILRGFIAVSLLGLMVWS